MSATSGPRAGRRDLVYPLAVGVIGPAVRLLCRVRVAGQEHLPACGPVLLVANHVSRLDPLVVGTVLYRAGRRVRFLAVSGLFDVPGLGRLLRATGMIPVVRGRGSWRMVRDACAALDEGEAVLIYPEGTVPPPGRMLRARPGAGLLALHASAPIVPLASWGLEPRPGRRPRLRRPAAVVIGPPVDLGRWRGRPDRAAQVQVGQWLLDTVRGLLPEAERLARAPRRGSDADGRRAAG